MNNDRIAVSEVTTFRWSFEEDVARYVEAGIAAIGVWRQKLSDLGEDKGIDLLQESGLKVSSLQWAGGFTGSEGRSYKDSLVDAQEAITLAANLGSPCLLVYTGARAGHTHNHARRLMKSALKELAPQAVEAGVQLVVEPMHEGCAGGFTFLTDLDDAAKVLADVGCDNIKLVLDTYHMGFTPSLAAKLADMTPQIGLVQVGDGRQPPEGEQNRCLPGEGELPLDDIIGSLLDNGYQGYFEIELLGEELETMEYADMLAASTKAVARMTGA